MLQEKPTQTEKEQNVAILTDNLKQNQAEKSDQVT